MIARHLLVMLRSAKRFRRYRPPSLRRVTFESLGVYLYSLFLASWFLVDTDWWPFKTQLSAGAVGIPLDYDHESTAWYYAVFVPLCIFVPFLYICYVVAVVYRQNLMPASGKRRTLAIYFFRLVVVFVAMWLPCLVLLFVTSPWTNHWVRWAGAFWGHLQGAVCRAWPA